MIYDKFIYFIFLLFIISGCKKTDKEGERIKISFSSFQDVSLETIASVCNVVNLDDSLHLIGEIKKIKKDGDFVFIYEMNTCPLISSYSLKTGKLNLLYNKYGKGPGEYRDIEDFCIYEGKLQIYERTGRKIINYDLNTGTYLGEIFLNRYTTCMERLNNGDYVLWCEEEDMLQVWDSLFIRMKYRNFAYNYFEDLEIPFRFLNAGDTLWFVRSFCDDIYYYTSKDVKVKYRIDFGDKKVPENILKISDMDHKLEQIFNEGYALAIGNIHFSGNKLFFSFTDAKEKKLKSVVSKGSETIGINFISYKGQNIEIPIYSVRDTLYSFIYSPDMDLKNPSLLSFILK